MKCILCGSKNVKSIDTIISDFVMARIDADFEKKRKNKKVKLCFCEDCTFAFYDYRFTENEEKLLYKNYRDEKYQQIREKYECWYTKKVNDYINTGRVKQQQNIIKKTLLDYSYKSFCNALDYGGNKGETFFDDLGTKNKYVFEISGVKPIAGVKCIKSYKKLKENRYDFIMCNMVFEHLTDFFDVLNRLYEIGDLSTIYYIEVPCENPFIKGNKFSIFKNISLLFNKNYNVFRLIKYYFIQRKQPFMPMKEHINFFTSKSIRVLAEKGGFDVIDIRETREENNVVLSMLFKKSEDV